MRNNTSQPLIVTVEPRKSGIQLPRLKWWQWLLVVLFGLWLFGTLLPDKETTMNTRQSVANTPQPSAAEFQAEYGLRQEMPAPVQLAAVQPVDIYACPSRTCDVVRSLAAGEPVDAVAWINGEVISAGQAIWYELTGGGYIYIDWVEAIP